MEPTMQILQDMALAPFGDTGEEFIHSRDFTVLINGHTYTAPEGSLTDGASIPRFFWRLIGSPFKGRYLRAAVIHDAAYRQKLIIDHISIVSNPISRADADSLLRDMMATVRIPRPARPEKGRFQALRLAYRKTKWQKARAAWFVRRQLIYSIVAAFGGGSWKGPAKNGL